MFNFKLLLLFVGVCGVILEIDSYSYPAPAAYPQPEGSYGYPSYAPAHAYPSYSAPSYGSYGQGYGYGNSYSANCAYSKVIEVLDQIFCGHAEKQSYSSYIYVAIDTVIDQLQWTLESCFVTEVYEYVNAAIHELETLQDAVYSNYGDSSLLNAYSENYDDSSGHSGGHGEGQTEGAGTQGGGARLSAANKLAAKKTQLNIMEKRAQAFKIAQGLNFQGQSTGSGKKTSEKEKTKTTTVEIEVDEVSQRAAINADVLDTQNVEPGSVATLNLLNNDGLLKDGLLKEGLNLGKRSTNNTILAKARRVGRSATLKIRKLRQVNYQDYSCSYLPSLYCSEDKYDELLYNILDRLYTALDFLWEALEETWDLMERINCGDSPSNEQCFQEAAISWGMILTSFYTILEVTEDVERMYEIMELDYGDDYGSYYRAGGSSSTPYSSPTQTSYSGSPSYSSVPYSYANTAAPMQSYPYSGYISQPVSSGSYYQAQPYRSQRAAVTPAVPQIFKMG